MKIYNSKREKRQGTEQFAEIKKKCTISGNTLMSGLSGKNRIQFAAVKILYYLRYFLHQRGASTFSIGLMDFELTKINLMTSNN